MEFIKTNEEYEIVKSIENSIKIRDLIDLENLLDSVSQWRAYIGMPKDDVSMELVLIVDYVRKNWGELTLDEFGLAWKLSINGKLEDGGFYGYFSPMYVGQVLNAYKNYKKRNIEEVLRRKDKKYYEQLEKKPSAEEQAENMRDILKSMYDSLLEKKEIYDPFNILYTFFRKHKWLKVNQTDIDTSLNVANFRYTENKQKNPFTSGFQKDKESQIKVIARNYLVEKYLEKNNIDILINNINSDLFLNLE